MTMQGRDLVPMPRNCADGGIVGWPSITGGAENGAGCGPFLTASSRGEGAGGGNVPKAQRKIAK